MEFTGYTNQFNSTSREPKLAINTFIPGLNIPGECQDSSCRIAGRKQIVQKGFGQFKISEIAQKTLCQFCHKPLSDIDVNKYLFYHCVYTAKGTSMNRNTYDFPPQMVERNTQTFGEIKIYNSVKWKELTFIVQELPTEPEPEEFTLPQKVLFFAAAAVTGVAFGYLLVQIEKSIRKG